jgi:drug/metabolite transporter (DMT)-like permease
VSVGAASPVAESYGRGLLLVATAGLLWSSGGLLYRLVESASDWQIVAWRTFFMGMSATVYVLWRYRRNAWGAFRRIGWWGLVGAVGLAVANSAFIFSLSLTYVANALLILAASPFIAAVLAWLLLRERVRRATVVAMTVVIAGVAIMEAGGFQTGRIYGDLLALLAVSGFALFSVCVRGGRHGDMMPTVAVGGLFSVLVAATMVLVAGDSLFIDSHDLGIGFLMGFAQVFVGMTLYIFGARHVPAAELALLSLTEVVMGPFWVWWALDEVPVAHTFYGGALVLLAVVINALTGMRRRHPLPQV